MNSNQLDKFITGNNGEDRFSDTCECYYCQELFKEEELTETCRGRTICLRCEESIDQCHACEKAMDNGQSYDNEYCDSCNESRADDYFDTLKYND